MAVSGDEHDGQRMQFVVSTSVELFWALHAAGKPATRGLHRELERLFSSDPALRARVGEFWPDGSSCYDELLVLAERAGMLRGVWPGAALAEAVADAGASGALPPLITESDDDRERILRRLEALAGDRRLRARYRELLASVWGALEQDWRSAGLARAEAGCRRLARRLEEGSSLAELFPVGCQPWARPTEELLALRPGPVTVAVSAFGGRSLGIDLCGGLLFGLTAPLAGLAEQERTAELGRRLRAVADPTRLAMLRVLADGPRRVGELAADLELAQPTVSNHLKVLREGGIVRSSRRGGDLALDKAAVEALMSDVRDLLGTAEAR